MAHLPLRASAPPAWKPPGFCPVGIVPPWGPASPPGLRAHDGLAPRRPWPQAGVQQPVRSELALSVAHQGRKAGTCSHGSMASDTGADAPARPGGCQELTLQTASEFMTSQPADDVCSGSAHASRAPRLHLTPEADCPALQRLRANLTQSGPRQRDHSPHCGAAQRTPGRVHVQHH